MSTRQRKQSRLRFLWLPVIAAAFLGYFGFHAYHGAYGIRAMEHLTSDGAALEAELAALTEQRGALEKRIALLRPESLDADLIDEEARRLLNMARPEDLVIRDSWQERTD